METLRKIILAFFVCGIFCFSGCASKVVAADDPLVIAEITPLPKNVQLKKKVLYEPIYGVMRVLEITLKMVFSLKFLQRLETSKQDLKRA